MTGRSRKGSKNDLIAAAGKTGSFAHRSAVDAGQLVASGMLNDLVIIHFHFLWKSEMYLSDKSERYRECWRSEKTEVVKWTLRLSRKLVLAGSFVVKEVSLPKLIYYKWSSTYNGVLSPLTGVLLADRVCVCVEVLADSL